LHTHTHTHIEISAIPRIIYPNYTESAAKNTNKNAKTTRIAKQYIRVANI